jgi:hypothetical protein
MTGEVSKNRYVTEIAKRHDYDRDKVANQVAKNKKRQ